jgi:hypothetical protein
VLRAAYIGAGAAILAAILGAVIAGVFGLYDGSPGTATSPAPPGSSAPGSAQAMILSETWNRPVRGQRVIDVLGTVQSLASDQAVFAIAGPRLNASPFYPGLASVSGNGTWKARIKVPAALESLHFWPAIATVPISSGACSSICLATFYVLERRLIAADGPHAAHLTRVGPAVQGRAGP